MGTRILIIKLGAIGDALRTTPLLYGLEKRFKTRHVTWVTDAQSKPVLENNPLIDRLVLVDPLESNVLIPQEFDYLFSLDKDPEAISLAMRVQALVRRGYAMTPYGTLDIFNEASRYSLLLGLDDHLKFNVNQKTYQETIFDIAELQYHKENYLFNLSDEDLLWASSFVDGLNAPGKGPRIGLNTGCGKVFATKKWPRHHFENLAKILRSRLDAQVFLLGGESEKSTNQSLSKRLAGSVVNTQTHPLNGFAGILSQMDCVVTGDTLAMHLTMAVHKKVVALFGPTCHQEIEFYGRGTAVVSPSDCLNCYKSSCLRDAICMEMIKPEVVFDAIKKNLQE